MDDRPVFLFLPRIHGGYSFSSARASSSSDLVLTAWIVVTMVFPVLAKGTRLPAITFTLKGLYSILSDAI